MDAAALVLHAEVSWSVTDLSVTPDFFFFFGRQRRYADILNSTTHSLMWLFLFRAHKQF